MEKAHNQAYQKDLENSGIPPKREKSRSAINNPSQYQSLTIMKREKVTEMMKTRKKKKRKKPNTNTPTNIIKKYEEENSTAKKYGENQTIGVEDTSTAPTRLNNVITQSQSPKILHSNQTPQSISPINFKSLHLSPNSHVESTPPQNEHMNTPISKGSTSSPDVAEDDSTKKCGKSTTKTQTTFHIPSHNPFIVLSDSLTFEPTLNHTYHTNKSSKPYTHTNTPQTIQLPLQSKITFPANKYPY